MRPQSPAWFVHVCSHSPGGEWDVLDARLGCRDVAVVGAAAGLPICDEKRAPKRSSALCVEWTVFVFSTIFASSSLPTIFALVCCIVCVVCVVCVVVFVDFGNSVR